MVAAPGGNETIHSGGQPPSSKYGPAVWRSVDPKDGLYLYQHCVWPHPLGKTHKGMIPRQEEKDAVTGEVRLIHSGLFWEGTEEEWHQKFRKE